MSRTSAGIGTSSWQQRRLVLSVAGLVFAAAFYFLLHGNPRLQAVPGRSHNAAQAPGAANHMVSQHALRPSTVTEHDGAAAPKIRSVTISSSVLLPECICCCPLAMYVLYMSHAAQFVLGMQQSINSHCMACDSLSSRPVRIETLPGTLGREKAVNTPTLLLCNRAIACLPLCECGRG